MAQAVALPAGTMIVAPSSPTLTVLAVTPTVAATPVPAVFTGTLKRGSKGPIVGVVQTRLAWTGLSLAKTSVFDAATVTAVRKFQGKQGLRVNGSVDSKTYKRLVAVTRRGAGLDPRCGTTGTHLTGR